MHDKIALLDINKNHESITKTPEDRKQSTANFTQDIYDLNNDILEEYVSDIQRPKSIQKNKKTLKSFFTKKKSDDDNTHVIQPESITTLVGRNPILRFSQTSPLTDSHGIYYLPQNQHSPSVNSALPSSYKKFPSSKTMESPIKKLKKLGRSMSLKSLTRKKKDVEGPKMPNPQKPFFSHRIFSKQNHIAKTVNIIATIKPQPDSTPSAVPDSISEPPPASLTLRTTRVPKWGVTKGGHKVRATKLWDEMRTKSFRNSKTRSIKIKSPSRQRLKSNLISVRQSRKSIGVKLEKEDELDADLVLFYRKFILNESIEEEKHEEEKTESNSWIDL